MPEIHFEEIRHFAPENFHSLVEMQSTRQRIETTTDKWDRTTERTIYYKGSKIVGMQTRTVSGYRYYIRKE